MKPKNLVLWSIAVVVASPAWSADPASDGVQFVLKLGDGSVVRRAELRVVCAPSPRFQKLSAADGSYAVEIATTATHLPEVVYERTLLQITNPGVHDLPLTSVTMIDVPADAGARVAGDYRGSPIVIGPTFLGVEHPLAENEIVDGRIRCTLPVARAIRPGESVSVSFVRGAATEPSQLRRAFVVYLERERPRPYAPFLHHNTWYNLGYGDKFSEADELGVISLIGRELVQKRGVKVDAFVLDDGWDDPGSLWRFHAGWPAGLKAMAAATERLGAAPGMWLSPWGGYGEAKRLRIAAAAPEGFEIRDGSFSLGGPRYYARFRDLCASVVRDNGVAFFKFDGIGAPTTGAIDPDAARDFDAMLRLIAELRRLRPGLYVSQTTGTWASPWWLFHVDNIWRGGDDHDFAGVGPDRERWLTFRDAQTYKNVVRRGPLFPLNSVMIHGVILARRAKGLSTDSGGGFRHEVRSYFGSGTQLQELYLSPELLSADNWDDLAAAANWTRANAATLRDTHWIGGDPGALQVYGWAAWSPAKGIVTLRNPASSTATFLLDVASTFELPTGATARFRVRSPYPDQAVPVTELTGGAAARIVLGPYGVMTVEAIPRS